MAKSSFLQFKAKPDIENPADVAATPTDNIFGRAKDNIYEVTVVAWDGDWEIGKRHVTIRVADANDEGRIVFSHRQPQVGEPLTATVKDQDVITQTIKWQWYRGDSDDGAARC